ncbi:hypothetical protein CDQ84_14465 [Clostridium thermosuccinogenes]|jgi:multiple sugar transport system substrate-binding protein|uniref:ABC transporter substrate-binding protein n=1 Tax=Clostridium thermosuccinogenes TaxID=84032 RepID=A0A2K2F2A9_9CLOT|nr:ABC transporter substrate-binding protein [Pseudoclostridium thermosuccinogenes]AUS96417.1 hypothetical protein CDO33_08235 [Pseudoclostridium thermosuccinogenes]PNT92917.1 hypothetical protein CDQ83_05000 [Pseudoclostridium thermosuccinogenes]PNT95610.1 hypothetical protein CDQ85_14330 [Pseudoclostridium thermosuccinogenes]PNT96806.1 hypothetical protein CDQ84_14465 [Pseudoclostridium thermosuccinogenes]
MIERKKALGILLVLAMVLAIFAGCTTNESNSNQDSVQSSTASGGQESEKTGSKPVTIKVWHLHAEDNEKTTPHQRMLEWAKEFNATNKSNITVEVSGAKTADVILTAVSSGEIPDIFMNYWNNTSTWADKGALLDLTDYVNNDKEFDKDDIMPAAWERGTYNGRIYAVPNSYSTSFLVYNKKMLREAGYDTFPATMEEMIKASEALTVVEKDGTITQMGIIPNYPWLDNVLWPVAFGAEWINSENKITMDSEAMKAAYQWQIDIYNKYGYDNIIRFKDTLGARGTETDPMLTGKVAMYFTAESVLPSLEECAGDVEWGVAPIPYPEAHPELKGSYMITSNVWQINAKTAHPDQAWEVLASLTSKETMKKLSEGNYNNGAFYSRRTAIEYVKNELDVSETMKEVAEILLSDNIRGFPMSAYINEYLTAINDEMNLCFSGEQNIDQAVAKIIEKVQPLADKYPIVSK